MARRSQLNLCRYDRFCSVCVCAGSFFVSSRIVISRVVDPAGHGDGHCRYFGEITGRNKLHSGSGGAGVRFFVCIV